MILSFALKAYLHMQFALYNQNGELRLLTWRLVYMCIMLGKHNFMKQQFLFV